MARLKQKQSQNTFGIATTASDLPSTHGGRVLDPPLLTMRAAKSGDLPSTYGGRVLDPPLLFMTAHEAN